jgi:UDP-N-acetylglucosamine diphosphorylase/glucosamine-1-phosphate N-acetyltransferase
MHRVVLIEDATPWDLHPFTDVHPVWHLRTGAFTTYERTVEVARELGWSVDVGGRELQTQAFTDRFPITSTATGGTLILAARAVVLAPELRRLLTAAAASNVPLAFRTPEHLVALWLPSWTDSPTHARTLFEEHMAETSWTVAPVNAWIISRLWEVLDVLDAAIRTDAELMQDRGEPLHHATARISPHAVIDDSRGPVIIGENVEIRAGAIVNGPCAIGANSTLKSHTIIDGPVTIGPVCKVGGEIEASVIQGYSNKQHDGFLGHSVLGEWVNLGAGTITSDLKNTYGEIHCDMPWGSVNTGRRFLGLLCGDHVKSAIGTRFNTGTVVGACSNVVSDTFPPKGIVPFTWLTPSGRDNYQLENALHVAETVMRRRHVEFSPAMRAVLTAISEGTA